MNCIVEGLNGGSPKSSRSSGKGLQIPTYKVNLASANMHSAESQSSFPASGKLAIGVLVQVLALYAVQKEASALQGFHS